jgi:hypothetical protein
MNSIHRPVPIYDSNGEPGALLIYPYLYNLTGEWIGWITSDRDVYSLLGIYVGFLSNDPRILRKRSMDVSLPRRSTPTIPPRLYPPANIPLAPLMPELPYDLIDVLLDAPEDLHTMDTGELREDME